MTQGREPGSTTCSLPTTLCWPVSWLTELFYSFFMLENFPQGCTSTINLCFYSLFSPITRATYVTFHCWTWMSGY
uniref:Uncharacterized protein n=1 Tax=Ursus americanus TaxID=9643 RepID=A0A452RPS3_URSAM